MTNGTFHNQSYSIANDDRNNDRDSNESSSSTEDDSDSLCDPQTRIVNSGRTFESEPDIIIKRMRAVNRLMTEIGLTVHNKFGTEEPRDLICFIDPFETAASVTYSVGSDWALDVLSLLENGDDFAFLHIGYHLMNRYADARIPIRSRKTFLSRLCSYYNPGLPYHGSFHGGAVANQLMSLVSILNMDTLITSYESLVLVMVALSHDAGHIGRNNVFLKNSKHPISVLYNGSSASERFSCSILQGILQSENSNVLSVYPKALIEKARNDISYYILCTDMRFHVKIISHFNTATPNMTPMSPNFVKACLSLCLKLADLGHACLHWQLHLKWTLRVTTEFYNQSDEEQSLGLPTIEFMCRERFSSLPQEQSMFLSYVVLPLVSSIRHWYVPQTNDNEPTEFEIVVYQQLINNIYAWSKWRESLHQLPKDDRDNALNQLFNAELGHSHKTTKHKRPLHSWNYIPVSRRIPEETPSTSEFDEHSQ